MISENSYQGEEKGRFTRIEMLGSGTYGDVYKVMCKKTGEYRALKKLKKVDDLHNGGIDPISIREIIILSDFNNKNVVKLIEVFCERQHIMLVFEYMRGSLDSMIKVLKFHDELPMSFDFLSYNTVIPIKDENLIRMLYNSLVQFVFQQLIQGLKYIHLKNVIHRDLKPANILINFEGESLNEVICQALDLKLKNLKNSDTDPLVTPDKKTNDSHLFSTETSINNIEYKPIFQPQVTRTKPNYFFEELINIKIADFGLARLANLNKNIPYTRNLVTLWYRAPELLMNQNIYDQGVDIWSLGCIFAEMILGFPIFKGENEVDQLNKIFCLKGTPNSELFTNCKFKFNHYQKQNLKDYLRKCNPYIDDSAMALVESMLKIETEERIKTNVACKHDFFRKDFTADIYCKI